MFESEPAVETQQQVAAEELYTWDGYDVIESGGFLYYQNSYLYACYNGFSYYLSGGEWYFNFWQWSCHYDSQPEQSLAGYYYIISYFYWQDYSGYWFYMENETYDLELYSWNIYNVMNGGGFGYY